jgi:hypothetical protein
LEAHLKNLIAAGIILAFIAGSSSAIAADDPAVAACKATGLIALKQKSSDISDVIIDPEGVAVSAADTHVEDVPVKTVVIGEAYIKRGGATGKPDRFVCLIGEKGKVLLTFFTAQ